MARTLGQQFHETVKARAKRDPEFREALQQAVEEAQADGEHELARIMRRDLEPEKENT